MHQVGLALHSFAADRQRFPEGVDYKDALEHGWCSQILPFLDQSAVYAGIDRAKAWDDNTPNNGGASNLQLAATNIPTLICPSSTAVREGATDYAGNMGTSLNGIVAGYRIHEGWTRGILVPINLNPEGRTRGVTYGEIPDGTSQTFLAIECIGPVPPHAHWADGSASCSAVDTAVNGRDMEETDQDYASIFSFHPQGGHALFGDAHVAFLSNSVDLRVLGALATRDGNEVIDVSF